MGEGGGGGEGDGGGAPESSVTTFLLTIGLIWLVTRRGRRGGVGQGGGQGGEIRGGHQSSVRATRGALVPLLSSLKT